MSQLAIMGFHQSNPIRNMTSGSKNTKAQRLVHFDPITRVWVLNNGGRRYIFVTIFLESSLYLFNSIFFRDSLN